MMAQGPSVPSIPEEGPGLADLGTNIRRLVQQNNRLLEALHDAAGHSPQELQFRKREEQRTEYKRMWLEEILPVKVNDGHSHLYKSFRWIKNRSSVAHRHSSENDEEETRAEEMHDEEEEDYDRRLGDVFSKRQPWHSWQYCAAYPQLFKFLETAESDEASRSEVDYFEFDQNDQENHIETWSSTVRTGTKVSSSADKVKHRH